MSFASLRLGPRVPAARAPHARPPPCYLRLARVMKAPPRPLSQKRAAEGLQGRVRRARVYVLSPAAGAARRSTPLPLRGPRASLERFTHYSDGFYGVFLPENVSNPCCSVAVKKESIPSPGDRTLIGSPSHGSGPSGPRPPMMLGISRCGRRSSARHWVWRCRYSPPSPAATNARPPCAAVRSTGGTFSATTRPPAPRTLAQPKRKTGPSEF